MLGNAGAVLSHAKGKGIIPVLIVPFLKAELANLSNSAAAAKSCGKSALKLAAAAAIIAALGFAISTAGVDGFAVVAALLIMQVKTAKRPISSQSKIAVAADAANDPPPPPLNSLTNGLSPESRGPLRDRG